MMRRWSLFTSQGPHMNRLRNRLSLATAVCVVFATFLYARAQQPAPAAVTPEHYAASTEWPTYGHDAGGMRFSPLTQITPDNVSKLGVAWVYHMKPEGFVPPARGGRGGPPPGAEAPPGAPPAAGRGEAAPQAPGGSRRPRRGI